MMKGANAVAVKVDSLLRREDGLLDESRVTTAAGERRVDFCVPAPSSSWEEKRFPSIVLIFAGRAD